jgi:hypothetical protein
VSERASEQPLSDTPFAPGLPPSLRGMYTAGIDGWGINHAEALTGVAAAASLPTNHNLRHEKGGAGE